MKTLKELYLPMSESTFLMLCAMLQPIHGYGIILSVENMTNMRIHLGAGTIYGALTRFEKDGVIKAVGEIDRKKQYVITEVGKELLEEEWKRLCELQEIGKEVLQHA